MVELSDDAGFDGAMLRCGAGVTIADLTIATKPGGAPAIHCKSAESSVAPIRLERVEVTQASSAATLVHIDCGQAQSMCLRADEIGIRCRNSEPSGALRIDGPVGAEVHVSNLTAVGCNSGVIAPTIRAVIERADITLDGSDGTAIDAGPNSEISQSTIRMGDADGSTAVRAATNSRIDQNRISLRGNSVGIDVGARSDVSSNEIRVLGGSGARALRVGGSTMIRSNRLELRPGRAVIGIELRGPQNIVSANLSTLGKDHDDNGTHVLVSSDQNLIEGNWLGGGDWGARPRVFEGGGVAGFTNGARLTGNNMIGMRRGCAILETGWHANANHCNWVGSGGAGFWVGSPGEYGTCSARSLISGNTIHSGEPSSSLIRFAAAGRRCLAYRPGSGRSNLKRCAARSSACGKGLSCQRATCKNIAIVDNLLLATLPEIRAIDFFGDTPTAAGLPDTSEIRITGNTLSLSPSTPFVEFRSDQLPKVMWGIHIAGNTPKERETIVGWKPEFGAPTPAGRGPAQAGPTSANTDSGDQGTAAQSPQDRHD